MSEQLQLRRGTATQIAAFTGAQGEVVVDTTNNRAVVCDGSTVGGWPAAKLSEVATAGKAVSAAGVNANSVADTALVVILPPGTTRYRIKKVVVLNPSLSLSAAQAGLYTAASGGGTAICAAQALSALTTNAANTAGNAAFMTQANEATFYTAAILYFRITTAQGSAATVDVVVEIQPC